MRIFSIFVLSVFYSVLVHAETVPFDQEHWIFQNASVTQHLDRTALTGSAMLKDVVFENGVIEVDIAVSGARSYPGLIFRMQSPMHYERFYILSDYNGRLFHVTPKGKVTEWMNTTALGIDLADLVGIPERRLIVIPSLMSNRLAAYRYEDVP